MNPWSLQKAPPFLGILVIWKPSLPSPSSQALHRAWPRNHSLLWPVCPELLRWMQELAVGSCSGLWMLRCWAKLGQVGRVRGDASLGLSLRVGGWDRDSSALSSTWPSSIPGGHLHASASWTRACSHLHNHDKHIGWWVIADDNQPASSAQRILKISLKGQNEDMETGVWSKLRWWWIGTN